MAGGTRQGECGGHPGTITVSHGGRGVTNVGGWMVVDGPTVTVCVIVLDLTSGIDPK